MNAFALAPLSGRDVEEYKPYMETCQEQKRFNLWTIYLRGTLRPIHHNPATGPAIRCGRHRPDIDCAHSRRENQKKSQSRKARERYLEDLRCNGGARHTDCVDRIADPRPEPGEADDRAVPVPGVWLVPAAPARA